MIFILFTNINERGVMKLFFNILIFLILTSNFNLFYCQDENPDIIGNWQGTLSVMNTELRIVFKISQTNQGNLKAVLDSPDQGAFDIHVDSVILSGNIIRLEVKVVAGFYEGEFIKDSSYIEGTWNQAGQSFPLRLVKTEEVIKLNRPQEPEKPYPYNEEEVTFKNKEAGITLAGTFTYPKDPASGTGGENFPAVVLVTGSGPENRDEELFGHKPFLVWADHLTRNGIAVLRFDDRGTAKSTGDFASATTIDFATDAVAAVEYLKSRKEVDAKKIGIAGHSEGGIVAPIAANKSDDVSFIVLVAGPAVPGNEILELQIETISRLSGVPEEQIERDQVVIKKFFDILNNTEDTIEVNEKLDILYDDYYTSLPDSEKIKPENSKESFDQKKNIFMGKWMRFFLKFDPRTELVKLDIPVFAIFGEKDVQVAPSQNKEEMEKALKKSNSENYKVVVLPGLNHIFQECETGAITEYAKIEQTASPIMLETMTDWIKEITD
jgi:pimeloyl-ACP methyl ester carboxylesterase